MKYQFIENHRLACAVEKMCCALKVTARGYYAQKKRGTSTQGQSNEELERAIRVVHSKSRGNDGSP